MEQPRNSDCVILYRGDTYPVEISDSLAASGWVGGQGVMWYESPLDGFYVTQSDGMYCGFLLQGSSEMNAHYTGLDRTQQVYKNAVMGAGGWLICTIAFERYTWASRQVPPLVDIVYNVGDRLVWSLRGLWSSEDEFSLSGDPRAPNNYYTGFVCQIPTVDNNYYMTIQTSI